jgi:hypothetical protein
VSLEYRAGRPYYYRHVRDGEKIRKEYVGAGVVAELASEADRIERERDAAEKDRNERELELLEALIVPILELSQASEVLVRSELVGGGYHRCKGEWRRKHEST